MRVVKLEDARWPPRGAGTSGRGVDAAVLFFEGLCRALLDEFGQRAAQRGVLWVDGRAVSAALGSSTKVLPPISTVLTSMEIWRCA